MGFGDSSAQFGGHGEVYGARGGAAEAAAFEASRRKRRGLNESAKSASAWLLLALVRIYMIFLSPFFGGACKFYPSCSNYAYEAIAQHGARRGLILAMKRLGRCRPFTKGGFDPVPDVSEYPHEGNHIARHNGSEINPHLPQGQQERRL